MILFKLAVAASAVALLSGGISAQAQTWDGGGANDANWSTAANWNPDGVPANNGTASVIFVGLTRLTPTVDTPWSINSMAFSSAAGGFTLGGSSLTIGSGGIANFSTLGQTINNPTTLSAPQVWNSAAGTLTMGGATLNNAGNTLTVDGSSNSTISSAISGGGSLIKIGSGNLVLSGATANTYNGTTTVKQGTLTLQKTVADGAITGNLIIGDNLGAPGSALVTSSYTSQAYTVEQIAPTANVTVNASGTWQVASQTIANLAINGGTVSAGYFSSNENLIVSNSLTLNGGSISSNSSLTTIILGGDITVLQSTTASSLSSGQTLNLGGATRTFSVADGIAGFDLDIASTVVSGAILKTGAGTLRLRGSNSFSGGFSLNAGSVTIGSGNAFGSGNVQVNGGTITTESSSYSVGNPLILSGDFSIGGTISVTLAGLTTLTGNRAVSVDLSGGNALFSGIVGDGGGGYGLTKTGSGVLQLTNANTYSGQTTVSSGTLRIGNIDALGSSLSGTIVTSGALLDLNGLTPTSRPLSLAGLGIGTNGALTNSSVASAAWNGPITLSANATVTATAGNLTLGGSITGGFVLTVDGSNTTTLSGGINNGSAGLTKNGSGVLLLPTANGFSGPMNINAGIVRLGDPSALGAIAGGTIVASGAALDLNGTVVGAEPLTISGTGISSNGALTNSNSTAASFGGPIVLAAASTLRAVAGDIALNGVVTGNFRLTVDGSFNTQLNGTISNGSGGLTKQGTGILLVGAPQTFTGTTTITVGTLRISPGGALPTGSALTISTGAVLDLNGNDSAIGSLAGSGAVNLGTATLTAGVDNTSTTFSGAITGSGGLIKTGTGTLTFSTANAYTGSTSINVGTLRIADPGALGNSAKGTTVNAGGALDLNGVTVGAIPLTLNGTGASSSGALTNSSGTAASYGGPITLASASTIKASTGAVTITGGITGAFDLTFDGTAATTVNSAINTGNANLIKNGTGTVSLTGAQPNSINGQTIVNAGILFLAKLTTPLSSNVLVGDGTGGGSADVLRFGADNQIASTSNMTIASSGLFDTNGYSGTIESLTMNGGAVSTGVGTLTVASDIVVNSVAGVTATLGGSVTTGGALNNKGTATITGSYSASGGISNSGSLTIPLTGTAIAGGPGFANNGTVNLSGGTLATSTTATNNSLLTGNGTISGAGAFVNNATFTLNGNFALNTAGTNTNSGNINLVTAALLNLGGGILTNNGSINLNSGGIAGSATLRNDAGGTIQGPGSLSSSFNNNGGTLLVPAGTINVVGAFSNSGEIHLVDNAANVTGGTITNAGTIDGVGKVGNNVTNNGSIEAVGGILNLSGTVSNGAAGSISASSGNKVLFASGLGGNAGLINLTGGTFDNNGKPLSNSGQVSGYGIFRSGGLTNNGTMTFTGGTSTIAGDVTNSVGKTINVTRNPAIFTGNVVNNGTFKTTATTTTFTGSFTNNGAFISDPATQTFSDLAIGSNGYLVGGVGDVFSVSGNFTSGSKQSMLWQTEEAELTFAGAVLHLMTWTGADRGRSLNGYTDNFSIGTLVLSSGASLSLLDGDATPGGAVYARVLSLEGGLSQIASITGNGLDLYYDPTSLENAYLLNGAPNGTYSLRDGGVLAPTPEPTSLMLIFTGVALAGLFGRKREGRAG